MQIEYPKLRIQNPLIDMSSHLVEQSCLQNTIRKYISQYP
jgi:hypothetical protein